MTFKINPGREKERERESGEREKSFIYQNNNIILGCRRNVDVQRSLNNILFYYTSLKC